VANPPTYWSLVRGTIGRIFEHDCFGLAAQAAFGTVISLVPAFIFLISVTSTIGLSEQSIQFVVGALARLLPAGSAEIVDATVRAAVANPAPGLLTTSLLVTLWSASGTLVTYTKGVNLAYGCKPRFAFWRHRAVSLLLVFAVAVPIAIASIAAIFGRAIIRLAATYVTMGPYEAIGRGAARWIATFSLVTLVVSLIYLIAPSRRPSVGAVVPGAIVATAIWAVVSIGFNAFTSSRFAGYKIYGSLAAVVVFLFWVYFSSAALLIGAELNAELSELRGESEGNDDAD
jgi:membrane protein